jgi:tyrosine-protein kinase Etk/Wzc
MNNPIPAPAPSVPPPNPLLAEGEDEGSFLLDLMDMVLDHRWLILVITAAGLAVGLVRARIATPIYNSNMVLQVDTRRAGPNELFSSATSLFDTSSSAAAEMEILRSRSVLGEAVDKLQLTVSVTPKYLPYIGPYLASRATAPSVPGFLGRPGYVYGNERLRIDNFTVARGLEGITFSVVATGPGTYQVLQGDSVIGQSRVGELLTFTAQGQAAQLLVGEMVALPGAEFYLSRAPRLGAVLELQEQLRIAELTRGSGIFTASISGNNREQLPRILNEIGVQYVRQDLERKAEEAEKAMRFLGGLLPQMRRELESAENQYNQFRNQRGTFNLSAEANLLLQDSVRLQTQVFELQQQRRELLSRFTTEHPQVRLLDERLSTVQAEIERIRGSTRQLPSIEQDMLRLTRDVKVNTELYTSLLNTFQQLQLTKERQVGNVRILDAAEVPLMSSGPNRMQMIVVSTLTGLLLALGAAWLRNKFRVGIKDPGDIEARTGLNLFATVPHSAQQKALAAQAGAGTTGLHVLALLTPNDAAVESLRSLRTALQFAMLEAPNAIVVITGPTPGIGKSFVSLNFAAVLGAAGKKVLLVDADLRKGRIHQFLGLKRGRGFTEVVSDVATFDEVVHRGLMPGVDFLSTGTIPPNPAELLLAAQHQGAIQQWAQGYDLVLIDTPPVLVASDTATVAPLAGTVFMVARALVTGIGEIQETVRRLAQAGVAVKGVVFNDLDLSRRRYGYGYGYGYKYGYRYGRYRYTQYKY